MRCCKNGNQKCNECTKDGKEYLEQLVAVISTSIFSGILSALLVNLLLEI